MNACDVSFVHVVERKMVGMKLSLLEYLDLPPEIRCRNLVFHQDRVSVSAWNIVLKAPKADNQKTGERSNLFGA